MNIHDIFMKSEVSKFKFMLLPLVGQRKVVISNGLNSN